MLTLSEVLYLGILKDTEELTVIILVSGLQGLCSQQVVNQAAPESIPDCSHLLVSTVKFIPQSCPWCWPMSDIVADNFLVGAEG